MAVRTSAMKRVGQTGQCWGKRNVLGLHNGEAVVQAAV